MRTHLTSAVTYPHCFLAPLVRFSPLFPTLELRLEDAVLYAFDTETYLIAPGRLAPRLVCLTYAAVSSPDIKGHILNAADGIAWFRQRLECGDSLVGHNVSFDLGVMVEADTTLMPLVWQAYDEGRIYDTGILERLRRIEEGTTKIDPVTGKPPRYSLSSLAMQWE